MSDGGVVGFGRRLSRWLHPRPRTRLAALVGAPAIWLVLLYIGSLVALFLNSAYRLNEDGSGIDKVLGTSNYRELVDRKSTRLNSSHIPLSRMPSSA